MNNDPINLSEEDRRAIIRVSLDYIEGWYQGDAERMEHSLHPELTKRIIFPDPRGFDRLEPISALALIIATRHGAGKRTSNERQRKDITILDGFGNTACVRVDAADWVDFLQLGKLSGQWQIINVLWVKREA